MIPPKALISQGKCQKIGANDNTVEKELPQAALKHHRARQWITRVTTPQIT